MKHLIHLGLLAAAAPAAAFGGGRSLMSPSRGRIMKDAEGHENDTKAAEAIATRVKAAFETSISEVKEIALKAQREVEAAGNTSKATAEKADEALTKLKAVQDQLTEIEQKSARGGSGQPQVNLSPGQQLLESESMKSLLESDNKRGRGSVELKATITSATTDAAGSAGDALQATRLPGINALPQRRMTVRNLLSQGNMDGASLEYVQETGFTNNAAMVAEGGLKPGSDIKLELKATQAKVIAHWMKASRQILEDVAQLRSIIDQRLLFGLDLKEESQLLYGDGIGQNLFGIVPQATPYAAPFVLAGATAIDTIRLAILQAVLAEYPASGIVMNPIDWARVETLKDADGRYIIGNPQGSIAPTLWGLPVVATPAMTPDKFLTGGFQMGAQLFDRWAQRVEVATENEDDFIRNLVTVLAEQREALAVYRPESFIYGDLGFLP